jgi:hypothetical protein
MPKLLILNLCKNSIEKLEPLAKCVFNDLLELQLEDNCLKNIDPLK